MAAFGARRRPSWLESLGRGAGSALTFGLADDAVGLVNPDVAARMRQDEQAARAANPGAFNTGGALSLLVPMGGLGIAGVRQALRLSGKMKAAGARKAAAAQPFDDYFIENARRQLKGLMPDSAAKIDTMSDEAIASIAKGTSLGKSLQHPVSDAMARGARPPIKQGAPPRYWSARERDGASWPIAGSRAAETRSGYGPRANPTAEIAERQAMREALRKLRAARARETDPEIVAEYDAEIAALRGALGLD